MNRQATDFALMAAAFSTDQKMATQVCKLLADGDVNETTARKMLALVRDGKLKSESPTCSHWWWSYPSYSITPSFVPRWDTVTVSDTNVGITNGSLTAMAQTISENAA